MTTENEERAEPPTFAKWLLWLLRRETWQRHPFVALVASVIALATVCYAFAGLYNLVAPKKTTDELGNETSTAEAPPRPISDVIRITNVDYMQFTVGDTNLDDEIYNDVGLGRELAFWVGDVDHHDTSFDSDHFGGSALLVDIECLQNDILLEGVALLPKSFQAGLHVKGALGGAMGEGATPNHVLLVDATPATDRERTFEYDEESGSFLPFIPFSMAHGMSRIAFQFARARNGRGTFELAMIVKRKSDPTSSKIVIVKDLKLAFMTKD